MAESSPPAEVTDDEIVILLQAAFAEHEIERCETHISQVFLTRHWAYKRKKPLRLDFLDYSTLPLRRQQCEQELRLNRRLARDVYERILPVTRDTAGQLALDGMGKPVEWLIKMRRLPDDQRLAARLRKDDVAKADIAAIARRMTEFYATAETLCISPTDYTAALRARVAANHHELASGRHPLPIEQVERLHGAQQRWLLFYADLLRQRVEQGWLVEGHGDLRAEHVYLTPAPIMIDCIEFNKSFRQLDREDELAFLAMECDGLDAAWVGNCLFETYRTASGDDPSPCLIAFYKCFRACVRAKVAAIREAQTTGDTREASLHESRQLLDLAESYLPTMQVAALVVVWGVSGSGKSTLAK